VAELFDELLATDYPALLHDGLHPNADGHQHLAEVIGERLLAWL
jgi:lysophospholipase L1-like esterase